VTGSSSGFRPRVRGGLRAVQAELGLSPTPLEIPDDEWSGASGSVDFGDTELRGPARSRVVREDRRKTRPETASRPSPETRTPTSHSPARPGARDARGSSRASRPWRRVSRRPDDAPGHGGPLMRRRTIAGWLAAVAADRGRGGSRASCGRARRAGDARRRRLGVGAADRRGSTIRAREHHGRRARHRPQHQQPDKVVESGDAVYLFSDSLSKVTEDRRGAAVRPRR
jgi:hypothetical protein